MAKYPRVSTPAEAVRGGMRLRGTLKEGWDSGESPTPPRNVPSISQRNSVIPPRVGRGKRAEAPTVQ